MRFKNRFLVLELLFKGAPVGGLREVDLYRLIRKQVLDDFGDFGLARASGALQVRFYGSKSHLCVLRASRDTFRFVWASVSFITHIRKRRVQFRCVHTASSLDRAAHFTLGRLSPPPQQQPGQTGLAAATTAGLDAEVAALRLLSRSPRISTSGGPASSSQARNPPTVDGGFLPAPIHRPIHRAPPGGDV